MLEALSGERSSFIFFLDNVPFSKFDLRLQRRIHARAFLAMSTQIKRRAQITRAVAEKSERLPLMQKLRHGGLEMQLLEASVVKDLTTARAARELRH